MPPTTVLLEPRRGLLGAMACLVSLFLVVGAAAWADVTSSGGETWWVVALLAVSAGGGAGLWLATKPPGGAHLATRSSGLELNRVPVFGVVNWCATDGWMVIHTASGSVGVGATFDQVLQVVDTVGVEPEVFTSVDGLTGECQVVRPGLSYVVAVGLPLLAALPAFCALGLLGFHWFGTAVWAVMLPAPIWLGASLGFGAWRLACRTGRTSVGLRGRVLEVQHGGAVRRITVDHGEAVRFVDTARGTELHAGDGSWYVPITRALAHSLRVALSGFDGGAPDEIPEGIHALRQGETVATATS